MFGITGSGQPRCTLGSRGLRMKVQKLQWQRFCVGCDKIGGSYLQRWNEVYKANLDSTGLPNSTVHCRPWTLSLRYRNALLLYLCILSKEMPAPVSTYSIYSIGKRKQVYFLWAQHCSKKPLHIILIIVIK